VWIYRHGSDPQRVEAVEKPSIASGRWQIMGNLGILAVPKGWLPMFYCRKTIQMCRNDDTSESSDIFSIYDDKTPSVKL